MQRIAVFLAALLVFAGAAGAATAPKKVSEPEAVILGIYSQYSPDKWPTDAEQTTFSPDLWAKWKEVQDAADAADDVGVDFDVFLDAQDTDTVTDISTKFTPDGADKGTVEITFTAFGEKRTIDYAMVKTDKGWKIDNIDWGNDEGNLRETLAAIRKDQLNPPQ
ncbi:MAG TPA: hypothetical protein VFB16_12855 [Bauldia sp.]|nr:hypothetical protein [Bauldia sp.]